MEQNLDVADPWLSRCHDECPVPCCDMSQISVMTAGSWTTCYIFCYITISYTQQHNMSEAHLTHQYVYSLSNLLGHDKWSHITCLFFTRISGPYGPFSSSPCGELWGFAFPFSLQNPSLWSPRSSLWSLRSIY